MQSIPLPNHEYQEFLPYTYIPIQDLYFYPNGPLVLYYRAKQSHQQPDLPTNSY